MAFTLRESYGAFLGGEAFAPNHDLIVRDPYTAAAATRVPLANSAELDRAIELAAGSAEAVRALPRHRRAAVLRRCAAAFEERKTELAEACCAEAGKPIRYAEGEVARLIDTFSLAADAALSAEAGELIPMNVTPRGEGYRGMTKRVAVGPCALVTPFNFPLNLVAHKVAPAIAAGCPFVLKPADKTPVGALLIGEVLATCDLPPGSWSILPAKVEDATALVEDDRIKLLSFTGSDKVGWRLKAKAGKKRVVLELGGNAPVIVDETMADELDAVAERVAAGAFAYAGQTCISVQRILVADAIYDRFRELLVDITNALKVGDPSRPETVVGPLINKDAAERILSLVKNATGRGATLLCGGDASGPAGTVVSPTLLENVPKDDSLNRDEAFGPVATLSRFADFDAALAEANDTRFGLQVGLFTRDLRRATRAWDALEYGGVIVNDVPGFRVDHMPYGGVKDSGLGREGVSYAVAEMTEPRLLVLRDS